jgi:hypothetical protein
MSDDMTIDERLEFLLNSTESLHATCQELHATIAEEAAERKRTDARIDANERAARKAVLVGMAAYLQALDGEDNGKT